MNRGTGRIGVKLQKEFQTICSGVVGAEELGGLRAAAYRAFEPASSARLTLLVTPEVFAYIYALVFAYAAVTDIARIPSQLIKEWLLIILLFRSWGHVGLVLSRFFQGNSHEFPVAFRRLLHLCALPGFSLDPYHGILPFCGNIEPP